MPNDDVPLFDVNALVALTLTTHQHHRAAHDYLKARVAWATCPMTEAALIRLLMNPAVVGSRRRAGDVMSVVAGFRADPRWTLLADHTTLATPHINTAVLMGHQQVTDLHLVNLAASHGTRLATFDATMHTWLAPADRRYVDLIPA
ncbi:MAG: hypothetical protein KBB39_05220 [Phycicoccus sp.]|nr:hypothetical protein [Phycicoccus sp.]